MASLPGKKKASPGNGCGGEIIPIRSRSDSVGACEDGGAFVSSVSVQRQFVSWGRTINEKGILRDIDKSTGVHGAI